MSLNDVMTTHADEMRAKTGVTDKLSIVDMTRLLDDLKWDKENLLKGTSDQYQTINSSQSTSNNHMCLLTDCQAGDKFTYSATITNTASADLVLDVWQCGSDGNFLDPGKYPAESISEHVVPGEVDKDVSVTIAITNATHYLACQITILGKNGMIQVKNERLYKGTEPGIWTPNPTDKVGG